MIEFQDVSLHFGDQDVLRQVRLRIGLGERVGVVGPNGAGKSTLFALITGEMTPFRGVVTRPRGVCLGHVRQQLPPDVGDVSLLDFTLSGMTDVHALEARIHDLAHTLQDQSGDPDERKRRLIEMGELETRFEHLGGYTMRNRAESILCGLGFPPAQLACRLSVFSGGWRMRAELARALAMQPDMLLLDEPSNYLDVPAVEWLQRYLRDFQGTMLLISHDRYLLRSLTGVTVEVARGEVTRYEGGYDLYVRERRQRIEQQTAAARNQEHKRQQVERFIERFRSKSTKASQVQSRIKALERMETVAPPPPEAVAIPIRLAPPPPCGHEMLRLENLGLTYDNQRWIFRNVHFEVKRGDRLSLVGYNGMGKTSLLRLMAGQRSPSAGRCVPGHKVRLGYQSQEFAETVALNQSVLECVRQCNPSLPQSSLRGVLGAFGFSGEAVHKTADVLSGGEKIRLVFARLFVDPPNLLLLDEPTTHLDVAGRESLEEVLIAYPGAICFVSHDIAFVRRLATGVIALSESGVQRFAGTYDDYQAYCKDRATPDSLQNHGSDSQPSDATESKQDTRKAQRRERAQHRQTRHAATRDLKRRLNNVERTLEMLETEQRSLLEQLNDAASPTDYAAVNRRLYEISIEAEKQTAQWELAVESLEEAEQAVL